MAAEILRGRLVLDEAVSPGRLVLEDGWITAVEPDPADAVAAAGPLYAPGYVDVHVHGWGGFDALGDADALTGMARALLRRGVTSFLPTAPSLAAEELPRFAARVRAWMPSAPADGAEPLGFNLEGPFLAPARKGAHDPALLRTPDSLEEAAIGELLDGLRVMTIAPELPGALALTRRLAGLGIAASMGHSGATLEEARAGFAAGALTTTHLFNAMTGVDHRAPGLAVAALTDDAAYVELIADGNHVHPALWPIITRTKPADRLLLVSDALPLAGTGDGRSTIGGLAVQVVDGRATLARHRDAGRVGDRARHGGSEPGPGGDPVGSCRCGGGRQPCGAAGRVRSRPPRSGTSGACPRARRCAAGRARDAGRGLVRRIGLAAAVAAPGARG